EVADVAAAVPVATIALVRGDGSGPDGTERGRPDADFCGIAHERSARPKLFAYLSDEIEDPIGILSNGVFVRHRCSVRRRTDYCLPEYYMKVCHTRAQIRSYSVSIVRRTRTIGWFFAPLFAPLRMTEAWFS